MAGLPNRGWGRSEVEVTHLQCVPCKPVESVTCILTCLPGALLLVTALELLDSSLDVLHATLEAHFFRAEVAVQAGA